MSGPYADAAAAVEAMWAANWTPVDGVPVLWHHNSSEAAPSRATTAHWLHVAVEFDGEAAVAFGSGLRQAERELQGSVVIRVLAARGLGEATALGYLDAALSVFRGARVGALSFIGDMPLQQPGASDDGAWWVRSGIAAFVYRFRG